METSAAASQEEESDLGPSVGGLSTNPTAGNKSVISCVAIGPGIGRAVTSSSSSTEAGKDDQFLVNETNSDDGGFLGSDDKMGKMDDDTKDPPVLVEEPIAIHDASSAGVAAGPSTDTPPPGPMDADVTPSCPDVDEDVVGDGALDVATNDDTVVSSSEDNDVKRGGDSLIAPVASGEAPISAITDASPSSNTCSSPIAIDDPAPVANVESTPAAVEAPINVPETPRERPVVPMSTPASAVSRTSSTGSTTGSILKNPLKKKKKNKKKKKDAASAVPPPQSLPFKDGSGGAIEDNSLEMDLEKEFAGMHGFDSAVPLLLLSLPVDSLHCIASFLSTTDWSSLSLASRGANHACREVFRRARMHGYRCATEVVMAWMRGQHADARELSALYIRSGVPIYPISLGHSYHTLTWRMQVEAKDMEAAAAAASSSANEDEGEANTSDNEASDSNNKPKVDKFYSDRYEARGHDGYYIPSLTYVEEKSMFWKYRTEATVEDNNFTNMHPGRRHSLAHGMALRPPTPTIPGGNNGPPGGPMFQANPNPLGPGRFGLPDGRNFGGGPNGRGGLQQTPSYRRTVSSGALASSAPYKSSAPIPDRPKISVSIHRHLADQHLFGRQAVDDEGGTMKAAPISLAADFFHPHLETQASPHHHQSLYNRSPYDEAGMAGAGHYPFGTGLHTPTQTTMEHGMIARNEMEMADAAVTSTEAAAEPAGDGPPVFADPNAVEGDVPNDVTGQPAGFAAAALTSSLQEQPMPIRPNPILNHSMSFGGVPTFSQDTNNMLSQHEHSILSDVSLDIYSCSTAGSKIDGDSVGNDSISDGVDGTNNLSPQQIRRLLSRFKAYQRRLDSLLSHFDSVGFEDCLLDFWDEFFPLTAGVHFYDRHSPVPRMSGLHRFLTKPCPKAVGIVQCEIERIKISSKKKGVNVKGRLFPTYEYRLFIRDRRHGSGESATNGPGQPARRDTVLMTAKNRGRNHQSVSGASMSSPGSKRGVNNFYLCLPQKSDTEKHFQSVNDPSLWKSKNHSGAVSPAGGVPTPSSSPPIELGRLQSNFIGTEFQIFSPSITKRRNRRGSSEPVEDEGASAYTSEDDADTDSNYMSDNVNSPNTRSRKKRGLRRLTRRPSFGRSRSSLCSEDEEEDSSVRRSDPSPGRKSRRGSWPTLYSSKPPRTNRRAIANVTDSSDSSDIVSMSQPIMSEEETGAITYTANLLGNRPRIMDVCIPKVLPSGTVSDEWQKYAESTDNPDESRMLNRFKVLQQRLDNPDDGNIVGGGNNNNNNNNNNNAAQNNNDIPDLEGEVAGENNAEGEVNDNNNNNTNTGGGNNNNVEDYGLLALQNRPPWWNIELGAFVLNFGGRVSVASVKNFQLCDRHDHDYIMLQFGRIQGRHSFTMDFQHPLTAVQAFAIAISSLQSKISFG